MEIFKGVLSLGYIPKHLNQNLRVVSGKLQTDSRRKVWRLQRVWDLLSSRMGVSKLPVKDQVINILCSAG